MSDFKMVVNCTMGKCRQGFEAHPQELIDLLTIHWMKAHMMEQFEARGISHDMIVASREKLGEEEFERRLRELFISTYQLYFTLIKPRVDAYNAQLAAQAKADEETNLKRATADSLREIAESLKSRGSAGDSSEVVAALKSLENTIASSAVALATVASKPSKPVEKEITIKDDDFGKLTGMTVTPKG